MSEPKYKLVPVEPDKNILSAMIAADWQFDQVMTKKHYVALYRAAIAAATTRPTMNLISTNNKAEKSITSRERLLEERIYQLDAAIRRVASSLTGKACCGVDRADEINPDTGNTFGPGGHTGWLLEDEARKIREALRVAREALGALLKRYFDLAQYWDAEKEYEVIRAREALRQIKELMGEK